MISLKNVRKSFGPVAAVKDISFQAQAGRITAFLGANGSGKTTTLRMLAGLLKRDGGEIAIDGLDPESQPIALRRRLAAFPDRFGLYDRLSTREHLSYAGAAYGLSRAEIRRRSVRLSEQLGMQDIIDRRAEGFSHGQRMKVALACCLIAQPRYLILDEPTRGLDIFSIRLLRQSLQQLASRGVAILFSSHVMQEVETLAEHIVVVSSGTTVAAGTAEELLRQTGTDHLEDAFVSMAKQ